MKRSISSTALLFASISAIIGSGWLFSSYYASVLAGPSVILSWVIGGAAMIIIAFVFGEVCAMLPITGSSARIPQFTHGTAVSFIFSWIIWLSYAAFAPIEVQAVIQYLAFYFPKLTLNSGGLTAYGYVAATFLMILVSSINIYSLRWLIRSNSFLTILKIVIPVLIALVILISYASVGQTIHPQGSPFMPFGVKGILAAISSGGIVFAFNGFKQAAEMGGEARNPKIALPFALIGSVTICLIIFTLLQIAFLNSLHPHNLVNGWQNLQLSANTSPLASIILENKLDWLFPLLYLCAIAAPLAAALMYCGSASRSLYGMSKNGYVPSIFQKLTLQGNPMNAIILNLILGMFMFAPLPGWGNMASFLSSLVAVTYSAGPITLLALRKQLPHQPRALRLPFAFVWSSIAFFISTLLIYWCGWNIIFKLIVALLIGGIILTFYQLKSQWRQDKEKSEINWTASIWMWVYFAGLAIISYLGGFGGGRNLIPFGWDFVIIGLFSMLTIWLALRFRLPSEVTKRYVADLDLEEPQSNKEAH